MAERTAPAAHLTDDDLAIMTSGRPYLGGWGTGAPWILTPEALTEFRGRMLAMATHEHAHCFDAEQEELGYVDSVPPLVQLTAYLFEALQGPFVVLDDTAYNTVMEGFKPGGAGNGRSLAIMLWPASFNGITSVWRILRRYNDIETTATIIVEMLDVLGDLPPLATAAHAAAKAVSAATSIPQAQLDAADDAQLALHFAGSLDVDELAAIPWLRGPEHALATLSGELAASAKALADADIHLPALEELLVSELVAVEGSVAPEFRTMLGGATFRRVRERVSAGEPTEVDRSTLSNLLVRAIRGGNAGPAHQWTTAAHWILLAARDLSGADLALSSIDLPDFADDLSDLLRDQGQSVPDSGDSVEHGKAPVPGGPSEQDETGADTDDPWTRLDGMVGLSGVKSTVRRALRGAELAQRRREAGITLKPPARHLLFLGNPGTGKTEVARLIGQIYRDRGVLRTGKLVEASRADLVGEGIGETAPKVRKKFAAAMGGVLFIDEAYTLNVEGHTDYGKEAVNELMTLMDNHRDDVLVIAAGYREQMQTLLRANPGLESRFGNRVIFDDFSDDELVEIFEGMVRDAHLELEDGVVKEVRSTLPRKRTPRYGNAREMRRLFEATVERQGMRLSGRLDDLTDEEVRTLTVADVREDRQDDEQRRRIFVSAERDLNSLVGLEQIKREVGGLVDEVRMEETLRAAGVSANDDARHMLFLGNPGTGKTEVARILARIYHGLGLLSQGHLVEVHRSDLVAGYIGQTALKTEAKIESAIGGVLFIDEAYSLVNDTENDFGQEAVAKLLTFMEDYRDDLVVIAAGYGDEMDDFLASNSGLPSRFPVHFTFPDYSDDELVDVLVRFAHADNRNVGPEALAEARSILATKRNMPGFGNARDVRTLYASAKRHQISRLADELSFQEVTPERVRTLLPVDLARALV
ncbi:AAA family ATPase [Brevibacterium yomogidense]|uniref:AAA family ATPase n=1 Tax=Brevibacterium yomogidense TaxID=946573 RepID=UPI0018DF689D|nr:AAA family ATPase [Brevibacterium yomogidense]